MKVLEMLMKTKPIIKKLNPAKLGINQKLRGR